MKTVLNVFSVVKTEDFDEEVFLKGGKKKIFHKVRVYLKRGEVLEFKKDSYERWKEKPAKPYRQVKIYVAPDGHEGHYAHFEKEARWGHLHGCLISF